MNLSQQILNEIEEAENVDEATDDPSALVAAVDKLKSAFDEVNSAYMNLKAGTSPESKSSYFGLQSLKDHLKTVQGELKMMTIRSKGLKADLAKARKLGFK